jgi:hypothetical protein
LLWNVSWVVNHFGRASRTASLNACDSKSVATGSEVDSASTANARSSLVSERFTTW